MKKINFQPSILQIIYLAIFSILFFFIIYTPTLIKGPLNLNPKLIIEEETIEGSLLFILFIMSVLILSSYKHEIKKQEEQINKINSEKIKIKERLNDSERHIGIMNVQIQEIKSIFNSVEKYPETKDDLKSVFSFFGNRIIGIVNSDWVLFRIIDSKTQRTLCDYFSTRHGLEYNYPHISNKIVIEKQSILPFSYAISSPKNLNIIVACIIPIDNISSDQNIFIQAIINEVSKLFVIFHSVYYKKETEIII
jgi:hypothetical protein